MMGEVRMETERLVIDRVRADDKADYFHNISHDRRVLETFICNYAETLDDLDFSRYLGREDLFAVRKKAGGHLIGILTYFDVKDGACEIGYGFGSEHWGRGYGTEAVRAFLDYCFDTLGLERVYASFFPENTASGRVMEKCGMTYDRVSEKELTYLGRERDLIYYKIDKSERSNRA